MTPEFVRCEFCKAEIPTEPCKLATYRTMIDGKEYVFCCTQCAQKFKQKKKSK